MTNSRRKIFDLALGIAVGLGTLAVGAAFLVQVISIYSSGPDKPFTRELVAEHLKAIAIPVWIWVALVIAGGIAQIFALPKRLTVSRSPKQTLDKLRLRIGAEAEEKLAEHSAKLKRYTRDALIFRCASAAVSLGAAVYCAIYFMNVKNFPSVAENSRVVALNSEVIAMIAHLLPFIAAAFLLSAADVIFEAVTAKRVLPSAKALAAESAKGGFVPQMPAAKKRDMRVIWAVRGAVGIAAVVFIVLGAVNGGARDVFIKAINICTECIGLG